MSVTATVQVLLKVEIGGSWGDDCTVGQVKKQALDAAAQSLNKAFFNHQGIKIVGRVGLVDVHFGGNQK